METNRADRTGSVSCPLYADGPAEKVQTSTDSASVMPPSKTAQMVASGDLGAMIAAMLLESGAKSREVARASKDAALVAEEAAMGRKLQKMEEAADQKLLAGIASASATAVSGAGSVVGGATAGATATGASQSTVGRVAPGAGTIGDGAAKLAAAYWTHGNDVAERDVVAAERAITQAKRGIDDASDNDKDAKELIGRALEHYKAFLQGTDDAKKATLFRA